MLNNLKSILAYRIAWWLPERIAYFAAIRVMATVSISDAFRESEAPYVTSRDVLLLWKGPR